MLHTLKENIIETSEQMIRVMEEGSSILLGLGGDEESETTPPTGANSDPIDDFTMSEEEEIANMKSPLDGIAEGVLGDIMKNQVSIRSTAFFRSLVYDSLPYPLLTTYRVSQAAPVSFIDNLNAFRSAITWNEPFIMGLIALHIIAFVLTIFAIKKCGMGSRMLVLTVMAGLVRSAEWFNEYGSKNWEKFASQNYFDDKGVFISIMMSGPLLMMAFFMLISYLREASGLLVEVKRLELRAKHTKNQGKKTKKDAKKKSSKKED